MARKTVTYKEPAGYFNQDMKNAAEKYEKSKKAKKPEGTGAKKNTTKKK